MAFVAVTFVLKLPTRDNIHWKAKLHRIDFIGAIVLVGAVLGFLVGLDRGSNVSWTMPLTIASLSISAVLFVLFVLVEIYVAAEPFAPGHIIFNRTFFACYCCNFFSFGGWIAALFYIPLYFQAVDGVSATIAGLRLLPSILTGVTGSLFAGAIMKWNGKYYWMTIAAYTSLTTGCLIIFLSSGGAATSLVAMIIGMCMSSFGNGIGVTTTLIGLSEYALWCKTPTILIMNSLKLKRRRPSCRNCLLIPVPLSWFRNRTFLVIDSCAAASAKTASSRSA